MAQRDLDAALQLLAHRAQYITGASGVAIALRREGKDDMLCRASTGSNAPELGALFSTELGLSGESVRTRQALRCDDAEVDARVNRDVCRQMGIASVVVMPVVNDDEVLGVFELFSGKANAFGARDVSAVQRLSEMVETAVRLAQAAQALPERLKKEMTSQPEIKGITPHGDSEDQILDGEVVGDLVLGESDPLAQVAASESISGVEVHKKEENSTAAMEATRHRHAPLAIPESSASENLKPIAPAAVVPTPSQSARRDGAAILGVESGAEKNRKPLVSAAEVPTPSQSARKEGAAILGVASAPDAPKKLFWSAALNPPGDGEKSAEADQSHVPPVLRSLRKCEDCGFPVSPGRALCVDCEEKKWRGQLRVPKAVAARPAATASAVVSAVVPATTLAKPDAQAFAATAQSAGASPAMVQTGRAPAAVASSGVTGLVSPAMPGKESREAAGRETNSIAALRETESPAVAVQSTTPEFVLSAGMDPAQSWLARNKYVVGVLLAVGAAMAAIFLLR
jgi:hypothetical protein